MAKSASSLPSLDESLKQRPEGDIEQGPVTEKLPEDTLANSTPETISPYHPSQFPDGGKDAWLCLLGVSICLSLVRDSS